MSVRELITVSSDGSALSSFDLRRSCDPVVDFGPTLQALVEDLKDTLMHHRIAVGLAAPQIGVSLRVFVVNLKQENEHTLVIINPTVKSYSGKKDKKKESCMSVPHFRGEVERRNNVTISYVDTGNGPQSIDVHGYLARVFMHELDHLDGVLYPDRTCGWTRLEPVTFFNN